MSVVELVARARTAHENLLIDACTITRPGAPVLDESTGQVTRPVTPVWSGRCRLKAPGAGAITVTERQAADSEQAVQRQTLVLPHGAAETATVGDLVAVESSPGAVFTVVGSVTGSTMTARSLLVEVQP